MKERQIPLRKQTVCQTCPIFNSYGLDDYVPFEQVGENPQIAIVGEAPGNDEVKEKRPFIGKAGQLLREVLQKAGISEYLLVNTVSCRPRKQGSRGITFREPTPEEIKTCSIHAKLLIKALGIKKVLVAGKTAIRAFPEVFDKIDPNKFSMGEVIAKYSKVVKDGIEYYPIYHPAYVVRNQSEIGNYITSISRVHGAGVDLDNVKETVLTRSDFVNWVNENKNNPAWQTIALDYETNTATPVIGRKLVGIGFSNGSESVYFEMRLTRDRTLAPMDLGLDVIEALRDFLKTRERVIVYNTSFESNMTYQLTGEWLDFDDAYTLAKIAQVRDKYRGGGLKYVAGAVLGVETWSDDVSDYVKATKKMLKAVEKDDFLKHNFATIARNGSPEGLEYGVNGNFVRLGKSFDETNTEDLPKTAVNKIKKLFKVIEDILESFDNRQDLLEILGFIEFGREQGLDGELLDWYSVPASTLARYNLKDTLYTYHLFNVLYQKYGEWYPNYIKQEWLSSHMESYMLAWDNNKAKNLAKEYIRAAIEHLGEIFALSRFRESYLANARKFVTIATLEREVDIFPKLSILDKDTRTSLRKMPVLEAKAKRMSLEENLKTWDHSSKRDERLSLLASVYGVLDTAVEEYMKKLELKLDGAIEIARGLDGDPEAITVVKEVFNPDSSHASTRKVFFDAFTTPTLKIAAMLDYVNQTFFNGEIKFTLENYDEFEAWKKTLDRDGAKKLRGFSYFIEDITKGINDTFFKGWYQIFKTYFGVNVDDKTTWDIEDDEIRQAWLLLYHTRIFKKIMKAVNGYILAGIQNALGAEIKNPTKPVIAYGSYNGKGIAMIQTTFHANTAETKRWQSPMHTIPRGSDIRLIYVPRQKNFVFVHFDYSQMEVRALAGLAKDPVLLKAYEDGIDVHRLTASRIFGKDPEDITKEERSFAKAATFSVLYGKGLESFARDFLHGDIQKAKAIINGFFSAYTRVASWVKEMHQLADKTGKVSTLFGDPISVNRELDGWDRRAQNYPIQSSASSLAALSGWELYQTARRLGIRTVVVGFTHDAFDFEVHVKDLPAFIVLTQKIAVTTPRMYGIPAEIDLEIGPNMGHMFSFEQDGGKYLITGPKAGYSELLDRLSLAWEVDSNVVSEFGEVRESRELFETKTAYSVSIGTEIPMVTAEISLKT